MVPWSWFIPLAGHAFSRLFLVGLGLQPLSELAEPLMPQRGQAGTSVGSASLPPAGDGSRVKGGPVLTPDLL